MNKERFQELITRPERIEDADLVQLQQVIRDFPFFHNAHLLLLYGLYKQKSEKFNDQVKQSSLYLSNRSFFVSAIYQGWQNRTDEVPTEEIHREEIVSEPVVSQEIIAQEEVKSPDVVELESEQIREVILEVTPTALPEPEVLEEKSTEQSLEISQEDSFTFSFEDSQVVEASDKKDLEDSVKQEATVDLLELDMSQAKAEDEPSDDLIDHFLKVNPRIVPKLDLEDSRGDISQPGLEENDEIVTETLAAIYEQQGHFLKAKEAFQKLILKFPEKSTYFASRIQELEKRIK